MSTNLCHLPSTLTMTKLQVITPPTKLMFVLLLLLCFLSFLGSMRIYTQKILPVDLDEAQKNELLNLPEYAERSEDSPFLYLTCDLPPPPLFRDEFRENIIPQVNLYSLLAKFNGQTEKEYKTYKENFLKRFEITKLPPFLILYVKRFTKNTFFVEKNPTIVNFPVKNVDFGEFLTPEIAAKHKYTSYDLIANIVHDGEPGKGTYRAHILHKGTGKWYEMQDLHVTDILPQMITLTEAYIQIYELRTTHSSTEEKMEFEKSVPEEKTENETSIPEENVGVEQPNQEVNPV